MLRGDGNENGQKKSIGLNHLPPKIISQIVPK